jgi:hypothetical protein
LGEEAIKPGPVTHSQKQRNSETGGQFFIPFNILAVSHRFETE